MNLAVSYVLQKGLDKQVYGGITALIVSPFALQPEPSDILNLEKRRPDHALKPLSGELNKTNVWTDSVRPLRNVYDNV